MDVKDRFLKKIVVIPTTECWDWLAAKTQQGYGMFAVKSKKCTPAHRASYELFVGEIPDDKMIHHVCKNRTCVNPTHLKLLAIPEHYAQHAKPQKLTKKQQIGLICEQLLTIPGTDNLVNQLRNILIL